MATVNYISAEAVIKVIETRELLGLYIYKGIDHYVAVDNSDGNAWTEEFKTLKEAMLYLDEELEDLYED